MDIHIATISPEGVEIRHEASKKLLGALTNWCGVARLVARQGPAAFLVAANNDACRDYRKMRGWCLRRAVLDCAHETARRASVTKLATKIWRYKVNDGYMPTTQEFHHAVKNRLLSFEWLGNRREYFLSRYAAPEQEEGADLLSNLIQKAHAIEQQVDTNRQAAQNINRLCLQR